MRMLLVTQQPETEQAIVKAAQGRDRLSLCVLHGEAQALERLFREPFDALLLDTAIDCRRLTRDAPRGARNLFWLLPRGTAGPLPTSVTCGFAPPLDAIAVLDRVERLSVPGPGKPQSEQATVSAALQGVGIPTHLTGFSYLKSAVRLILRCDRPTELRMQQDVYARLAASTHKSASTVEHAMRHAIEAAWLRADARVLERLFGYTVSADRATPSNEAFLYQMCEHIRMQQKEAAR